MADRLIRVHPEDFEYLKGLYPATYFVRIDNVLFVSIEDEMMPPLSTQITQAGKFGIHEDTVLKVIDGIALAGYKIVPK